MPDLQEQMLEGYDQSDDALFDESCKARALEIDESVPVLLNQCIESYNAMYRTRSHEVHSEEDQEFPIWIGKLTLLLEERADIPLHTYSRVVHALQEMNCVVQLQKGSRRELGRWLLVHHPTKEAYEGMQHSKGRKQKVRSSNINKRISQLYEICRDQQQQIDLLLDHLGLDSKVLTMEEMKRSENDGKTEPSE